MTSYVIDSRDIRSPRTFSTDYNGQTMTVPKNRPVRGFPLGLTPSGTQRCTTDSPLGGQEPTKTPKLHRCSVFLTRFRPSEPSPTQKTKNLPSHISARFCRFSANCCHFFALFCRFSEKRCFSAKKRQSFVVFLQNLVIFPSGLEINHSDIFCPLRMGRGCVCLV